jgi:hypothetical protein
MSAVKAKRFVAFTGDSGAAFGHGAAAPPRRVMHSRRLMAGMASYQGKPDRSELPWSVLGPLLCSSKDITSRLRRLLHCEISVVLTAPFTSAKGHQPKYSK